MAPDQHWGPVPDAEPNATAIKFPATYCGVQIMATAVARHGQIDIVVAPGKVLEIPWDEWQGMAPFLTAVALTHKPD